MGGRWEDAFYRLMSGRQGDIGYRAAGEADVGALKLWV